MDKDIVGSRESRSHHTIRARPSTARIAAIRAWLQSARDLRNSINAKMSRIDDLKSMAARVTTIYGEHPRSDSYSDSRYDAVAQLVDAKRELDEQVHVLLDRYARIEEAIRKVPAERYRTLLEMRYLACMTWEAIAEQLLCDVRSVYRLHGDALERVAYVVDFGEDDEHDQ